MAGEPLRWPLKMLMTNADDRLQVVPFYAARIPTQRGASPGGNSHQFRESIQVFASS
jgi:hypothetical protein